VPARLNVNSAIFFLAKVPANISKFPALILCRPRWQGGERAYAMADRFLPTRMRHGFAAIGCLSRDKVRVEDQFQPKRRNSKKLARTLHNHFVPKFQDAWIPERKSLVFMVVATGLSSLDQQDHLIYPVEHDAMILSAVKDCLEATGYRSVGQLRCEVDNGVVQLHGELPSYFLKQVAQETVRQVKGIREVKNFAVVR
jgi:hypothetical protein